MTLHVIKPPRPSGIPATQLFTTSSATVFISFGSTVLAASRPILRSKATMITHGRPLLIYIPIISMMIAWRLLYLVVKAINVFYWTVPYDKFAAKTNEDRRHGQLAVPVLQDRVESIYVQPPLPNSSNSGLLGKLLQSFRTHILGHIARRRAHQGIRRGQSRSEVEQIWIGNFERIFSKRPRAPNLRFMLFFESSQDIVSAICGRAERLNVCQWKLLSCQYLLQEPTQSPASLRAQGITCVSFHPCFQACNNANIQYSQTRHNLGWWDLKSRGFTQTLLKPRRITGRGKNATSACLSWNVAARILEFYWCRQMYSPPLEKSRDHIYSTKYLPN